jgi:hypothetical protein
VLSESVDYRDINVLVGPINDGERLGLTDALNNKTSSRHVVENSAMRCKFMSTYPSSDNAAKPNGQKKPLKLVDRYPYHESQSSGLLPLLLTQVSPTKNIMAMMMAYAIKPDPMI